MKKNKNFFRFILVVFMSVMMTGIEGSYASEQPIADTSMGTILAIGAAAAAAAGIGIALSSHHGGNDNNQKQPGGSEEIKNLSPKLIFSLPGEQIITLENPSSFVMNVTRVSFDSTQKVSAHDSNIVQGVKVNDFSSCKVLGVGRTCQISVDAGDDAYDDDPVPLYIEYTVNGKTKTAVSAIDVTYNHEIKPDVSVLVFTKSGTDKTLAVKNPSPHIVNVKKVDVESSGQNTIKVKDFSTCVNLSGHSSCGIVVNAARSSASDSNSALLINYDIHTEHGVENKTARVPIDIAYDNGVSADPMRLKFAQPGDQTVTLKNSSTLDANIKSIVFEPNVISGVDILNSSCSGLLKVGGTCTFTVKADASAWSASTEVPLVVKYEYKNTSEEETTTVKVDVDYNRNLKLEPSSLVFDLPSVKTLTLTNDSMAPVTVDDISFVSDLVHGVKIGDYSSCKSLASKGSCTVDITADENAQSSFATPLYVKYRRVAGGEAKIRTVDVDVAYNRELTANKSSIFFSNQNGENITFVLSNNTLATATIKSIDFNQNKDSVIQGVSINGSACKILEPQEECQVILTSTKDSRSDAPTPLNVSYEIASKLKNTNVMVDVTYNRALTADPSKIAFDNSAGGSTTINITNSSLAEAEVTGVEFAKTGVIKGVTINAAACMNSTLAAGKSCAINLTASKDAASASEAELDVKYKIDGASGVTKVGVDVKYNRTIEVPNAVTFDMAGDKGLRVTNNTLASAEVTGIDFVQGADTIQGVSVVGGIPAACKNLAAGSNCEITLRADENARSDAPTPLNIKYRIAGEEKSASVLVDVEFTRVLTVEPNPIKFAAAGEQTLIIKNNSLVNAQVRKIVVIPELPVVVGEVPESCNNLAANTECHVALSAESSAHGMSAPLYIDYSIAGKLKQASTTVEIAYNNMQKPLILSSSNHNLLSIGGKAANGKIIVKNNSQVAQKMQAHYLGTKKDNAALVIDPHSSCLVGGVVAPGKTCEFDITYQGQGVKITKEQYRFVVNGWEGVNDYININLIDLPVNTFYKPDADDTNAKGLHVDNDFTGVSGMMEKGNDILYVGSQEGGSFKSTDGGDTWFPIGDEKFIGLDKTTNTLYARPGEEVFNGLSMSADNGATWLVVPEFKALHVNTMWLAKTGIMYALTDKGLFEKRVDVWQVIGPVDNMMFAYSDPSNEEATYFGAGGKKIIRWVDGIFTSTAVGIFKTEIAGIVNGSMGLVALSLGGDVHLNRKDTNLWDYQSTLTEISNSKFMVKAPFSGCSGNVCVFVATDKGLFQSDSGFHFQRINISEKFQHDFVMPFFQSDSASAATGSLYIGDNNFEYLFRGKVKEARLASGGLDFDWSRATFALDPEKVLQSLVADKAIGGNPATLYGAPKDSDGGIFVSYDGGANWSWEKMIGLNKAQALYFDHKRKILYAEVITESGGTNHAQLFKVDRSQGVWNWLEKAVLEDSATTFLPLFSFCQSGDILYVGTKHGIRSTSDGGESWTLLDGSEDMSVRTMGINVEKQIMYVVTDDNVVRRYDISNKTWQVVGGKTVVPKDITSVVSVGNGEQEVCYIGAITGVFKMGAKETEWSPVGRESDVLALYFDQNKKKLYAVIRGSIYGYSESGVWEKVTIAADYASAESVAGFCSDGENLYAMGKYSPVLKMGLGAANVNNRQFRVR